MADVPRLFVSTGDTSGDQHTARLMTCLHERVPGLQVEGLGGPALAAAGCEVHVDLVRDSIFGISGALAALPHLFGVLRRVAGILDARRPDAVVLVDYPGLNLFVARLARRRGIPVIYFVAPQLWAWAPWRVRRFARVVDHALVILPFEQPFFRAAGMDATYIGHPALDGLPEGDGKRGDITARPRPVALLPGSRPREVGRHMPLMLAAAEELAARHPDCSFHSAHVSPDERHRMAAMAAASNVELHLHADDVHGVMASCRCAVVSSGTATLETGLLGTPMVVLYAISRFERMLRHLLVVPQWVGQVNLVAGQGICPELLLVNEPGSRLAQALEPLLSETPEYERQKRDLDRLRQRTAGPGAVLRAADLLAARLWPDASGSGHPAATPARAPHLDEGPNPSHAGSRRHDTPPSTLDEPSRPSG